METPRGRDNLSESHMFSQGPRVWDQTHESISLPNLISPSPFNCSAQVSCIRKKPRIGFCVRMDSCPKEKLVHSLLEM